MLIELTEDDARSWEDLTSSDEEDSDEDKSTWDIIFSDFKQNEYKDVPLKFDPEFRKYFQLLQSGLSKNAVRQLMEKDGKEKDVSILDMDPDEPLDRRQLLQHRGHNSVINDGLPLVEDPEYSKYFVMLANGVSFLAVEQLLLRDGKDTEVLELDPSRSLASQVGRKKNNKKKNALSPSLASSDDHRSNDHQHQLLKDDPRYSQYFEMLRTGTPVQTVKETMTDDGKEPSILDLDHNLPLETQKDELPNSAVANLAMDKIRSSLGRSTLPISASSDLNFSLSIARQARRRNSLNSQTYLDDVDDCCSVMSTGSISTIASVSALANAEALANIRKAMIEAAAEEAEEEVQMFLEQQGNKLDQLPESLLKSLSKVMESSAGESSAERGENCQESLIEALTEISAYAQDHREGEEEKKDQPDSPSKIYESAKEQQPKELSDILTAPTAMSSTQQAMDRICHALKQSSLHIYSSDNLEKKATSAATARRRQSEIESGKNDCSFLDDDASCASGVSNANSVISIISARSAEANASVLALSYKALMSTEDDEEEEKECNNDDDHDISDRLASKKSRSIEADIEDYRLWRSNLSTSSSSSTDEEEYPMKLKKKKGPRPSFSTRIEQQTPLLKQQSEPSLLKKKSVSSSSSEEEEEFPRKFDEKNKILISSLSSSRNKPRSPLPKHLSEPRLLTKKKSVSFSLS